MKDRYDIRIPTDINENTREPNNGSDHRMSAPESEYSLRVRCKPLNIKIIHFHSLPAHCDNSAGQHMIICVFIFLLNQAYSSILYLKPRMQIIIRGQKVKTELVSKSLAHVIKDTYKPIFLVSFCQILDTVYSVCYKISVE